MAELTHHDTDDGFHEIQLSGKQLVFLFMFATSLAVAIFLCGVQVGRNVRSDRVLVSDASDASGSSPAAPPPASAPTQPVASGGPPASEPPAPAAEPDDELSYAKRLQADSSAAEKLKPPADAPAAKAPPTPKAQPAPKPAEPVKASAPAAAPASSGRPGQWIVQVISLQDRAAAAKMATRLSGRGYPAFVLEPSPGAPRIFRVQVGGYADKSDAEQAARRLEKDEQLKPLVRSR